MGRLVTGEVEHQRIGTSVQATAFSKVCHSAQVNFSWNLLARFKLCVNACRSRLPAYHLTVLPLCLDTERLDCRRMEIRKFTIITRYSTSKVLIECNQILTLNLLNESVLLTLLKNTEYEPVTKTLSLLRSKELTHEGKCCALIFECSGSQRRLHAETCVIIITDEELWLTLYISNRPDCRKNIVNISTLAQRNPLHTSHAVVEEHSLRVT